MKKLRPASQVIILLTLVLITILVGKWHAFRHSSMIPEPGLRFVLPRGNTVKPVLQWVNAETTVNHPIFFEILLGLRGATNHLRAGEYFFPTGSTPDDVIRQMTSGSVIYHRFIIVNGWNIYQVLAALNADPYIKHTLQGQSLQQIAQSIGVPYSSPEGLLYPDTYFFALNDTDLSILQRSYGEMQGHMDELWAQRAPGLPYRNPYQALIVASMVTKETNLPIEMPIVAGIILKRVKIGMHLQIDSAVIYGLQPNFDGDLDRDDLHRKTPYNTYTNYGLPPTPISMPGRDAIQGALHPMATPYLYFVSKGDGSHEFSRTLSEQSAAIKKYILKHTR